MGYVKVEEFTVQGKIGDHNVYYKYAWRANARKVDGVYLAGYLPVPSETRVTMSYDEAIALRDDIRARGGYAQAFRTETVEWQGPMPATQDADSEYW